MSLGWRRWHLIQWACYPRRVWLRAAEGGISSGVDGGNRTQLQRCGLSACAGFLQCRAWSWADLSRSLHYPRSVQVYTTFPSHTGIPITSAPAAIPRAHNRYEHIVAALTTGPRLTHPWHVREDATPEVSTENTYTCSPWNFAQSEQNPPVTMII